MIIDDAADLSEHAEVALLKTLEEPPSHAVLLLITPTTSRLLETIRSRLQPVPFRSVARLEIERALVGKFGESAARFAAPAAGKPGIAFTLASDESARTARKQFEAEFYRLVGSKLTERFGVGRRARGRARFAEAERADRVASRELERARSRCGGGRDRGRRPRDASGS